MPEEEEEQAVEEEEIFPGINHRDNEQALQFFGFNQC
jgi:hypothetical protein